jgi:hypothetical protein
VTEAKLRGPILGFGCFLLLCGIFYAGLKPFHATINEVSWLADYNGIRFGEHGTILSPGEFPPSSHGIERSVELWLQPALAEDSSTILGFYRPGAARRWSLHQSESDMEVRIESSSAWRHSKISRTNISGAFRNKRRAFWAVTSGSSGTKVYRNGGIAGESPQVRPSSEEFSGRLVVANSPIYDDYWQGVLGGLAIYDSSLTGAQIARHYQTWTQGRPVITAEDACIALYLLDERGGTIAHNQVPGGVVGGVAGGAGGVAGGVAGGTDLLIPKEYMVLNKTVLDPVWVAFDWSVGYWTDALINIAGFIPLGCLGCAFLTARGVGWPMLTTSALGFAISLVIELTQSHLPTRDSSMSDLINNTAGSIIGALLYRGAIARAIDWSIAWMIRAKAGLPGGARRT